MAGLVFAWFDKFSSKQIMLPEYNVEHTVWINSFEKNNETDLYRTANLLEKRLKGIFPGYEMTHAVNSNEQGLLLKFKIKNTEDTLFTQEILSSDGLLEIFEMYTVSELNPFLETMANFNTKKDSVDEKESTDSSLLSELALNKPDLLIEPHYSDLSAIGSVNLKDTAELGRLLRLPQIVKSLPNDARYCYGSKLESPIRKGRNDKMSLYMLKTRGREKAFLQNDDILKARLDYENYGPIVSFEFTEKGSYVWENLTRLNINRPLAILVGGKLISAPKVSEAITGGRCMINGDFTVAEARSIALMISGQPLPARSTVIETKIETIKANKPNRKLLLPFAAFLLSAVAAFLVFKTLKA
ncbi:MAG TPA: hypothetical protein VF476_04325, partial [Chitinophagaceae bacterium]